jgi:hypothetical protein
MQGAEISKVLTSIEKQGSYRFLYNSRLEDMKRKVDVAFTDADITEVMATLFARTSLTYRRLENNLIAIRSEERADQDIQISGKVTDEQGQPVEAASVSVKGASRGTSTNAEGSFTLSVPPNATIVISAVGFITQELPVGNQTTFEIKLAQSTVKMDEVVVIGYGTARKGDLTSSIGTIKPEELKKTPSGALLNAVQGNVPGVQISSFGGPGDVPEINIRGIKSLYGGSVLYVVDGVFVDNIDFLTPNDIQDYQV